MAEVTQEHHQNLIREKLNGDKIKLWLPPFTLETGEKGEEPKELIKRYSVELKLDEDVIKDIIESLRQHALQKLAERNQFQTEGIATLKVKLPVTQTGRKQVISVKIKLEETGRKLRELVAESSEESAERLKLISTGKVITDDLTLKEQNLKNGSQIMTVLLSVTETEAGLKQREAEQVMKTREAAELLSSRAAIDDTEFDVQIADQTGRPLKLPKEEKKALTLAMTLHEKGRCFLKEQNYSSALLLLLEADLEFCKCRATMKLFISEQVEMIDIVVFIFTSKCRATILEAVDNYAVLCLDIVWSYLCLKNLDQLPDAARRLKTSEDCLIRSYGSNMERLTAVKGKSGSEVALFMRLHLLQGVIAFHQHDFTKSSQLLKQAENDLKKLTVDPNLITQVMSMGFSERESRLGLRACDSDILQAVDYIMTKKKEKEEIKMKVKADREKRKKVRHLGKTANGDWVNPENFEMLLNMGYRPGAAAEAIRQANNDVNLALEVLQTKPELLDLPDPLQAIPITDAMIIQLTMLGFEPEMCRRALIKHHGDSCQAAADLVQSGGVISERWSSTSQLQSSSDSSGSSASSRTSTSSETDGVSEEQREVLNDLVSDIKQDEDEYLDLNLEEEKQFLSEYRALLDSLT
ncbi:hypothetical protein SNE40_022327 [Patella caerulea]|uniref:NEDD8 ultimate buster 1 n=1 Tax=Patella caerulea TaxID=87958 RepID=A0AAN8IVM8_PATCE